MVIAIDIAIAVAIAVGLAVAIAMIIGLAIAIAFGLKTQGCSRKTLHSDFRVKLHWSYNVEPHITDSWLDWA